MTLEDRITALERQLAGLILSDRYVIARTMQFQDGRNIQLAKGTGTKIGTEATQKLGFYGVTPVVQQSLSTVSVTGSAQDSDARTAINNITNVLKALGFSS